MRHLLIKGILMSQSCSDSWISKDFGLVRVALTNNKCCCVRHLLIKGISMGQSCSDGWISKDVWLIKGRVDK